MIIVTREYQTFSVVTDCYITRLLKINEESDCPLGDRNTRLVYLHIQIHTWSHRKS